MKTVLDEMTDGDTITIIVPVTGDDGTPEPLTGATVAAAARERRSSVNVLPAAQAVTDGVGGIIEITFAPGTLAQGLWDIHVQVTKQTGEVQTVARGKLNIAESLF